MNRPASPLREPTDYERYCALPAVHEACHVALACAVGVKTVEASIRSLGNTAGRCWMDARELPADVDLLDANMAVTCAGDLGAMRFARLRGFEYSQPPHIPGDDQDTLRRLGADRPDGAVERIQWLVMQELGRPTTWAAVERIATRLLQDGEIYAREIALLADPNCLRLPLSLDEMIALNDTETTRMPQDSRSADERRTDRLATLLELLGVELSSTNAETEAALSRLFAPPRSNARIKRLANLLGLPDDASDKRILEAAWYVFGLGEFDPTENHVPVAADECLCAHGAPRRGCKSVGCGNARGELEHCRHERAKKNNPGRVEGCLRGYPSPRCPSDGCWRSDCAIRPLWAQPRNIDWLTG